MKALWTTSRLSPKGKHWHQSARHSTRNHVWQCVSGNSSSSRTRERTTFLMGVAIMIVLLIPFLYLRSMMLLPMLPAEDVKGGLLWFVQDSKVGRIDSDKNTGQATMTWSQSALPNINKRGGNTNHSSSSNSIVMPRPFQSWPRDRPLPCFNPWQDTETEPGFTNWFDKKVQRKPAKDGLFFLKLCKTASSTAAGIHLRIARNLMQRQQASTASATAAEAVADWPLCRSRFLHGMAGPRMYRFGHRNTTQSFLWTMLREPTQRYVSEFFHFDVTRKARPVHAVPQAFPRYLRHGPHSNHHSLSWLAVNGYTFGKSDPWRTAQSILNTYNFIGVSERFDESIVVLGMLLGIPLRDVLYLSSKRAGGYDGLCYKIQPSHVSSPMQQFLDSAEWKDYIAPEVELWKAANASLDLTIERLGRNKVQQNLRLFQNVLTAVSDTCTNVTKFPCTAQGEPIPENETDCLVVDMGCGFDCIDAVADAFHME